MRCVPSLLRVPVLASALALALAAGCGSTRLTSTWRDPALESVSFDKVVGIAMTNDSVVRRLAEDEVVRAVGPDRGDAGYTLIPDEELRDRALARGRLEAAGIDGAVVYRVASVEEVERWVPPTSYGSMWGYWGWAGPMAWDPGSLRTDEYVQVETTLYSVPDARLVWAGRSETINPGSLQDLIGDVVRVSVAELREERILP
jgi:hypothetical protein